MHRSAGIRSTKAARPLAVIATLSMVAALAACGSSSSKASTTKPSGSSGATTAGSTGSSSGSTGTTSGSPATNTSSPTLITPLCGILDASTVVSVVGGAGVGSCQNFANEGDAGRCLWGKLGQGNNSAQLSAFTGADFTTKKLGWQAVFPKVSGAGQGAWSNGAHKIGGINNVVLYVDYGSFGMEFAVSSPTASVQTAVDLAKAIK
jgi:hypothetical protein